MARSDFMKKPPTFNRADFYLVPGDSFIVDRDGQWLKKVTREHTVTVEAEMTFNSTELREWMRDNDG